MQTVTYRDLTTLEDYAQVERALGGVVDQHDAQHALARARTVPGGTIRKASQMRRLRYGVSDRAAQMKRLR